MATRTRPRTTPPRPAPPDRTTLTTLTPSATAGNRNVTIADYIVEQIRAGVDPQNAAGMAGVLQQEFSAWMREGALAKNRLDAGADWDRDFTPEQQDCCLFSIAAIRAHSMHIGQLTRLADQAALGTLPERRIVTVKRETVGKELVVVEETERTETIAPDMGMLRWKLEKLEPTIYGTKATLNVNVTDMTDTDATVDIVEQRMREVAAALAARAIEASASEVPTATRGVNP